MTKHIGIVACSAEGASLCYRTICVEGSELLGPHAHPEVSMHTPPLADYVACLDKGDIEGVGNLMLTSSEKLAQIGADFLICPDNTIHQAFDYVSERSPRPWLHIVDAVQDEASQQGFKKLGLLGTTWLMASSVYPAKLTQHGIQVEIPPEDQRAELGRIIMDELVNSKFLSASIDYYRRAIDDLKARGCDAVILGCTEIPLIIDETNASLPILDSTRLLARAALRKAVS
ncbi:MAG: amino acid racemase [Pseudomonadota bacterium]